LTSRPEKENMSVLKNTSSSLADLATGSPISNESLRAFARIYLDDLASLGKIAKLDEHDLRVSAGYLNVYKISYTTQLNSIEFITGKKDIRTKTFSGDFDLKKAQEVAGKYLEKKAKILDVVFSHREKDLTKIDVSFSLKPVINYITFKVTV